MKIPSPVYAIGALGVLAFLGEMNKRGYYGSTFGYEGPARSYNSTGSRAWKDIPDKYRKMSSSELRKLAASGDSVAAEAYEEKQMAYDAFRAGLDQDERQDERRYGRRA